MNSNTIYADGKRAILYLRVSTEEQVDNFSLGTQENICRQEAEKRGYEIVEVFREEGRSAKTIVGRPVLINLIEYCRKNKNKIKAVFVYRLDRVSRITGDYLAIRKKLAENDVTIISATEPTGDGPTEKLVETILAGFAQLDNDIKSERARNGLRARYLSGLIVSGYAPLGYSKEAGYAVKDPKKWDTVKRAWELMATGSKSLKEMAESMNEWGLRWDHKGKEYKIRPQTANKIFRSKFYMGMMSSKTYKEEVRGQHVPMITEQVFYKVQAILDGRNVNQVALSKRSHARTDLPLRRIVRCDVCGTGLTGGWSQGRHKKYAYYRCSNKQCTTASIPIQDIEDSLLGKLKIITPKEKCLKLFINFMYKTYYERASRLHTIRHRADEEIERLQGVRRQLVQKNLSGVYSDEVFKEQSAIIESQMTKAQIAKNDATFDDYNIDKVISFMKTILADLGETYKKSSLSQLKVLLGSIFPTGIAWNDKTGLNTQISPLYQSISAFDTSAIRSCAGERT